MADEQDIPPPDAPPPLLNKLVDEHIEQLFDVKKLGRVERLLTNALQAALTTVVGVVLSLAAKIGSFLGKTILEAENMAQPDFNELARVAVQDMFGVDPGQVSTGRGRKGSNKAAADAIGDMLLRAFAGQATGATASGELEPSDAPAKTFLSAMAQLALEGWLEGWLVEALTLGQIETFGELDDTISHVLGLGRAAAAVHGPIVRHLIVEPLEWKLNREHRPALLSPSQVARQWFRGKWDWADVEEELARAGYSDARIDAILNEARRFISDSDITLLNHRFLADTFDARAYLIESGYDAKDADLHLLAGEARILDTQEKQLADTIVAAYVSSDITEARFRQLITGLGMPQRDTDHYLRFATLKRELNVRPLSDSDAQAAVKRGIETMAWYRAYLADSGFDDESITIKELLLRGEMDQAADAAKLKADQAAAKAAAQLEADRARAQRVADQARADAQPAYSEVRRAYVRGLVDRNRLEAAIVAAHPGIASSDAAALVADADVDRATYLEQQAKHDAAVKRDQDSALPLSTLEQSVLRGITTIDSYDAELARRGISDADRRIYVALLRDKLADQQAAADAKAAAAARAQLRGISIPDFVRAVRLGLRSVDELEQLLAQLDTPDVQAALIVDLVKADMARDQAAAAKRATADAAAAAKAINLPLRRRAVLKGLRTREQYAADLAAAGVALDDRELELGLVDLELEDAAAKRAKAEAIDQAAAAAESATPRKTLTLAQTVHAVKLGILAPDDLRAFMQTDGYTDADIETYVASVVADIPTVRQAATVTAAAGDTLASKNISLADLENAVARGLRTLDDYQAEVLSRGFSSDDAALMRELLGEKVGIDLDGLRAKVDKALAGVSDAPTRDELEAAIVERQADDATIAGYLTRNGVARDVATVYVRLLHTFAPAPR